MLIPAWEFENGQMRVLINTDHIVQIVENEYFDEDIQKRNTYWEAELTNGERYVISDQRAEYYIEEARRQIYDKLGQRI